MKKFKLVLTIVLIFNTIAAISQYLSFEEGIKNTPEVNTTPELFFVNGESSFVEITYKFLGAYITETNVKGEKYQFLHIDDFTKMGQIGAPALPAHNDIIAMPENSVGKVIILDSEYFEYDGFNIHPVLKPMIDTEGAPEPKFQKDEVIYGTNEYFPKDIVDVTRILLSRETPLAITQIRPVQFNPVTGKIRVYSKINFRLEYMGNNLSFSSISEKNTLHYTNLLKRSVINSESIPDGISSENYSSKTGEKNYIIITHDEYESQANNLAIWKRKMGYTVEVVSQSSWTSAQVKTEIHDRYNAWIPRPDYFVIIGDHDGAFAVPGEICQDPDFNDDFATDLYYACMGGGTDITPDMAHGRISVSSSAEAQVVVNKIINYEKNPAENSDFYENGLNCAQYQDDDNNGYADRRFCHTSEDVRDYIINDQGYNCERIYFTNSSWSVTDLHYENGYYSNGELLPADLRTTSFNWSGNSTDITNAIDNGKFYVFHRDHGFTDGSGWAHPLYTTATLDYLTNGDLLPVVFSINCYTGKFTADNCFAEKFIRLENKGAVGVIAPSYWSHTGFNNAFAVGMFDAIWSDPGLFSVYGSGGTGTNYTIGPGNDIYSLGDVLNQGLVAMEQNWDGLPIYKKYQNEIYHWFGDPSMKIWTSDPNQIPLYASHPFSLGPGATSIHIDGMGVPDALATLVYDGHLVGKTQLSGYSGWIFFDPLTDPSKDAILTISKHNHKPYLATIDITDYGVWTGAVSEDWDNAANWSGYTLPDNNINVTIPDASSVPHSPVIEGCEAYCLNLFLEPGAIVMMNDYGYLHCYGNFNTSDGQFTMNGGHSYLYFKGFSDTYWRDGNGDDTYSNVVVMKSLNKHLKLRQSATILGTFVISEGVFEMNNYQTLTVVDPVSFAFQVEDGGELFLDESNEYIDVAGDITFFNGSRTTISAGIIRCGGNFVVEDNTNDINLLGTILRMNGSSDQIIDYQDYDELFKIGNLTINKSGGTCYMGPSDLDINGDLLIMNGALSCAEEPYSLNCHDIYIEKNWTNNVGETGFVQGIGVFGGRVIFDGGNYPQYISDEHFNELELNKASGGGIRMDGTHVVCNEFDWTAGIIYVLNEGSFTADDLYDDGIYGKWILDGGTITIPPPPGGKNDPKSGPVDLNGEVHIHDGTMFISGTSSHWPGSHDALIEMSGGVLDLTDCGIDIINSNYTLTENITGGTIRTTGSFKCGRNDFHPDGGTFEFYGSGDDSISQVPGSTLYDVVINKAAMEGSPLELYGNLIGDQGKSNTVALSSDLVITNDLIIDAGTLDGEQWFIYVGANWTNNVGPGGFIPNTGTVIFSGSNNASILTTETFYNLTIAKLQTANISWDWWPAIVANELNINSGSFIGNNDAMLSVSGNVNINQGGIFEMTSGCELHLDDGSTLTVSNGARLKVLGEEANGILVTNISTGTYSFNVSGIIEARYTIFENMDSDGINVGPLGYVSPNNPDNRFNHCTFRKGAPAPSTLLTLDNDQVFIIGAPRFEDTYGNTGSNVRKTVNHGEVTFIDYSGAFSGEAYEDDVFNRIFWVGGGIELELTLMLEGPYSQGEMLTTLNAAGFIPLNQPYNVAPWYYTGAESVASIPNPDVADWILIELRDTTDAASATSGTVIAQQAAFLLKDGSVVGMDGSSNLTFPVTPDYELYVVAWHRNHIGIMSAIPLIDTGGIYSYDFSTGAGQVFGGANGHKEIAPGIWGMAGADGNGDGQINNGDKLDIWSPQAGSGGYLSGDFDLDSQVNNGDKNDVWIPNTGIGGQVPQ
ncbi:MAG: hypothetical protein JXA03_06235 [Bacteroidales bacterium]|nr:hypothetical protein [Bacteroidales bacterium]